MPQRFAVEFWKKLVVTALVVVSLIATAGAAPATVSASGPEGAAPGDQVTVSFSLTNTGDNTSAYILDITVPEGWTVINRTDDGGIWKSSEKKWLWQSVDPGQTVSPSVTLQVPDDASGDATVSATGKDASGVVGSDSITISIQSDTPTDTPTDEPGDEPTDTPTDTPTDEPTDTPADTPTEEPTDTPADTPTDEPDDPSDDEPDDAPTETATDTPTDTPTGTPTDTPTGTPTDTSEERTAVPSTATPTDTLEDTPTEPSTDMSGGASTDTAASTVTQPGFGNDLIIVGGLAVYAAGVLIRRRL